LISFSRVDNVFHGLRKKSGMLIAVTPHESTGLPTKSGSANIS